jgi:hypothetical protein
VDLEPLDVSHFSSTVSQGLSAGDIAATSQTARVPGDHAKSGGHHVADALALAAQ